MTLHFGDVARLRSIHVGSSLAAAQGRFPPESEQVAQGGRYGWASVYAAVAESRHSTFGVLDSINANGPALGTSIVHVGAALHLQMRGRNVILIVRGPRFGVERFG
jgi:hypothetical protein